MASVDVLFQDAVASFSRRLTQEEINDFNFSSLEDVLVAVEEIQDAQGRRRDMMHLARIKRFLEAMSQYGEVIAVFLNASPILCFVWGPVKLCLQVRSSYSVLKYDYLLSSQGASNTYLAFLNLLSSIRPVGVAICSKGYLDS